MFRFSFLEPLLNRLLAKLLQLFEIPVIHDVVQSSLVLWRICGDLLQM